MNNVTGNDILIYLQIAVTVAAFLGLWLKVNSDTHKTTQDLSAKIAEIDTKFTQHIAVAETNIEHIMNKLGMSVREKSRIVRE